MTEDTEEVKMLKSDVRAKQASLSVSKQVVSELRALIDEMECNQRNLYAELFLFQSMSVWEFVKFKFFRKTIKD